MIKTDANLAVPNELDHVLRWMGVDPEKMKCPVSEVAPIN